MDLILFVFNRNLLTNTLFLLSITVCNLNFSFGQEENADLRLFNPSKLEDMLLSPELREEFKRKHNASAEDIRKIECEFRSVASKTIIAFTGKYVSSNKYDKLTDSLLTIFDEKFTHFKQTGQIIHEHHHDEHHQPIEQYRLRNENIEGDYEDIVFSNRSSCFNADFENGNTDGWTASYGSVATGFDLNLNAGWDMGPMNGTTGNHAIMGPGAGNDAPSGNAFPRVFPGAGDYSIRLGNQQTGRQAARIRYEFPVTEDTELFLYHFAAVLEDPGHSENQQPFLSINLIVDGEEVECGEYFQAAASGAEGFVDGPNGVRYRPWTTVSIALTNYIGQNAIVEFTTADCAQGAHFGYAYIDAECTPMPTLEATPINCDNPTANISAPEGADAYSWSGPGIVGNSTSQTITVNQPGEYTVTVTPVQGPTCEYILTTQVIAEESDIEVAFIAEPPQFCLGNAVQFTDETIVLTGEEITSYEWDFGDGNTSSDQNPSHTYSSDGEFTVNLTVTTESNCSASTQESITVFPSINNTDLELIHIECNENLGRIIVTDIIGGTEPFEFELEDVETNTDGLFADLDAGDYTLNIVDANGCPYSIENIIITSTPGIDDVDYTAVDEACDQLNGSINVDEVFGGTAPFNYDLEDVSQNTTGNFTNLPGNNEYILIITDANDCNYTLSIPLENTPSITDAVSVTTSEFCDQQNGTISVTNVVGGTPIYNYTINSGASNTSGNFPNLSSGEYSIDIVDEFGCTYTIENILVDFVEGISDAVYNVEHTLCAEDNGTINIVDVIGGTPNYTYTLNNSTTNEGGDFNDLSSGDYIVTITDSAGCTYDTDEIIVDPSGTIEDVSIVVEAATCLEPNGSFTFSEISGGTPPYLINVDEAIGDGEFYEELFHGVYTYTITDDEGCIYEGLVEVPLEFHTDNVRIPNVITANNDGVNDFWFVDADCVEEFECVIINRWGNKVYEYFDINEHWDGRTLSGKQVSEGVYFYLVNITFVDGAEEEFHGNITVVR